MNAIYTNSTGIIRVYPNDYDPKVRDQFVSVVSVFWIDPKTAFLFAALTSSSNNTVRDLLPVFNVLIEMGATTVQMKRTKNRKMPLGKVVKKGIDEDVWEVDLMNLKKL